MSYQLNKLNISWNKQEDYSTLNMNFTQLYKTVFLNKGLNTNEVYVVLGM